MSFIPIIFIALSYTLGTSSLWFVSTLPQISHPLWFGSSCLIFCFGINSLKSTFKKIIILLLIATAGFFFCLEHAQQIIDNRISKNLEGVPLIITGKIISIPEAAQRSIHFEFLIQHYHILNQPSAKLTWPMPQKIRLNWYFPPYQKNQSLTINQQWQFSVKLKQPRSTYNPASVDYEAWLFSQSITAVGSISAGQQQTSTIKGYGAINQWRTLIAQHLENSLGQQNNLGIIEALAIGLRNKLSISQWQIMQATGTNHLVAIAGLHIGFVFSFIYGLSKYIWRRFFWLMLWLPAHEAAILLALSAAIYYSALSGFALPTQRALVMLGFMLLASLCRRTLPIWHTFSIALISLLIFDPLIIFSTSFWLSFIAVGMIIFSASQNKQSSHWQQLLRMQWIVTLGLAPLTLYFFHQISFINLVANMIAIPWVGFIALPLILGGIFCLPLSPILATNLWQLAAKSLTYYWPCLEFLAQLDQLQWKIYIPNLFYLLFAIIGVIYFFAPKGFPCRMLGLLGFLPLIFSSPPTISMNEFKISQLDVGQGLSTLIQTAHHQLIFDTGPRFDDHYDMGESVVVPALMALNIRQLDALIISHGDNDHSGGAGAVLHSLPVKFLLTSVPSLYKDLPQQLSHSIATTNKLPIYLQKHWEKPVVMSCEAGQHWQWDGVKFVVLSPNYLLDTHSANNRSCVIHVHNAFHSILLTGDIEKSTENFLLAQQKGHTNQLSAEIIVAPHHGSKTSSSQDFLMMVHPSWVFYATGYRNRFHFPSTEVIQRYQTLKASSINTAEDGQVIIAAPNQACCLTITKTRLTQGHFWNFK